MRPYELSRDHARAPASTFNPKVAGSIPARPILMAQGQKSAGADSRPRKTPEAARVDARALPATSLTFLSSSGDTLGTVPSRIVKVPEGALRVGLGTVLLASGVRLIEFPHYTILVPVILVLGAIGAGDRKSTRLNSSHLTQSRMPSSA